MLGDYDRFVLGHGALQENLDRFVDRTESEILQNSDAQIFLNSAETDGIEIRSTAGNELARRSLFGGFVELEERGSLKSGNVFFLEPVSAKAVFQNVANVFKRRLVLGNGMEIFPHGIANRIAVLAQSRLYESPDSFLAERRGFHRNLGRRFGSVRGSRNKLNVDRSITDVELDNPVRFVGKASRLECQTDMRTYRSHDSLNRSRAVI